MRCDFCKADADWRRPPTKMLQYEAFRCDQHLPKWRVREFEALTTVANARKAALDEKEMPRPSAPPPEPAPAPEPETPKAKATTKRASRRRAG